MTPKAIALLRRRLGLSQPQFAQLFGIHAMTVSRWERLDGGLTPNGYQLALMAEFKKAADTKFDDSLSALLVGAGVAAVLLLLLSAARGK